MEIVELHLPIVELHLSIVELHLPIVELQLAIVVLQFSLFSCFLCYFVCFVLKQHETRNVTEHTKSKRKGLLRVRKRGMARMNVSA
jgi:dolichol kinase